MAANPNPNRKVEKVQKDNKKSRDAQMGARKLADSEMEGGDAQQVRVRIRVTIVGQGRG